MPAEEPYVSAGLNLTIFYFFYCFIAMSVSVYYERYVIFQVATAALKSSQIKQ